MVPLRLSLIVLLIGLSSFPAWGQDQSTDVPEGVPDTVVQRVSTAFTNGNPQLLLSPSADRVEVSLFGTRTFYSSAQAFYVLRDFFDSYPPVDFALGDATGTGNISFLRGQFDHIRDERTLQIYVRLVQRDGAWQLHEVRIDSDVE